MALLAMLTAIPLLLIAIIVYRSYKAMSSPLRSVQGPLFARFTRLWLLFRVQRRHFEQDNLALHSRYGKIVRLSPDTYSIDDPEVVKTIYGGAGRAWRKSNFYTAFETPGEPNIFTQTNIQEHGKQRRKYANAFTMSTMTSYEKYVDNCVEIFKNQMDKFAIEGRAFNVTWWLQCYAFDVIGEITFSRRFGFLDQGDDINGFVSTIHGVQSTGNLLGIVPEWISFVVSCGSFLAKWMKTDRSLLEKFYLTELRRREEKKLDLSEDAETSEKGKPQDFLTKFYNLHKNDPTNFTTLDLKQGIGGNITAGSDTTGISLTAIVYYLYSNPAALQTLRQEIFEHVQNGNVSDPITFAESQQLEYLQAVIKETLRLWPATAIPFYRVVPDEGATLSGKYFPSGTVVGINPWVAHRNRDVFGPDALEFRPERWLKSHSDPEKLSRMSQYWMPFGIGSRTCIGKNISLLEIGKLIPQLVRHFDFDLSEELLKNGPQSENIFFLTWRSMFARVYQRREPGEA